MGLNLKKKKFQLQLTKEKIQLIGKIINDNIVFMILF